MYNTLVLLCLCVLQLPESLPELMVNITGRHRIPAVKQVCVCVWGGGGGGGGLDVV